MWLRGVWKAWKRQAVELLRDACGGKLLSRALLSIARAGGPPALCIDVQDEGCSAHGLKALSTALGPQYGADDDDWLRASDTLITFDIAVSIALESIAASGLQLKQLVICGPDGTFSPGRARNLSAPNILLPELQWSFAPIKSLVLRPLFGNSFVSAEWEDAFVTSLASSDRTLKFVKVTMCAARPFFFSWLQRLFSTIWTEGIVLFLLDVQGHGVSEEFIKLLRNHVDTLQRLRIIFGLRRLRDREMDELLVWIATQMSLSSFDMEYPSGIRYRATLSIRGKRQVKRRLLKVAEKGFMSYEEVVIETRNQKIAMEAANC